MPYRSILFARWYHPNLLELRVSRRGVASRGTIVMRENAIWSRLKAAINREDLVEWDLTPVRVFASHRSYQALHFAGSTCHSASGLAPGGGMYRGGASG